MQKGLVFELSTQLAYACSEISLDYLQADNFQNKCKYSKIVRKRTWVLGCLHDFTPSHQSEPFPYSWLWFPLLHMKLNRTECHTFTTTPHGIVTKTQRKFTLKNLTSWGGGLQDNQGVMKNQTHFPFFQLKNFQNLLQTLNKKFPEGILCRRISVLCIPGREHT